MRAALQAQGWAELGPLLSESTLDSLRAASARLIDEAAETIGRSRSETLRLMQQWPDPWRRSAPFAALTRHPGVLDAAREALGTTTLRLVRQHLVIKPADMAHELPWHQDITTWPVADPEAAVAVWVALDTVTEETGAIRYIPGSHRGRCPQVDPVTVPVAAGAGLLHHALVWHASATNTTPTWRRACIHVLARCDAARRGGAWDPERHPLR